MSITDELRKFAWAECPSKHLERVIGIADDIDAALADYIQLPKDADGVTIRIGDQLDSVHSEDGIVAGIRCYEGGRTLVAVRPHGRDTATWNDPFDYTHAKPDSWERIIRDARAMEGCGSIGEFMERHGAELVERCKRLAGEGA